ncbi:hypothetical protein [Arthrobacter sp. SLBN-122]|uniref:hypothetical protein n=1 Tax=Arthrobacter sp. SLBN-122 TaxID=2768455 RepID=UPI00114E3F22|nr:hypothetical protein [Arthrobacter sp. SLBN-122]TQJ33042.1 hypothetical protein FBY36_0246 [Arthrobacter sp. SLBN-122]
MIRDHKGHEISVIEASRMVQQGKVELVRDVIDFDGGHVLVRSRLRPIAHRNNEPLFTTTVIGDRKVGMQEYATDSEEACVKLHTAMVGRYQLLESARANGVPKVLLDGVL